MPKSRRLDIDLEDIICPYCGKVAVMMSGRELYGDSSSYTTKNYWVCRDCDAHVGCHLRNDEYGLEGNEPLGKMANRRLRMARIKVHIMFDPLWKVAGWNRTDSYMWLAKRLGIPGDECHIGNFNLKTCAKAIKALDGLRKLLNLKGDDLREWDGYKTP